MRFLDALRRVAHHQEPSQPEASRPRYRSTGRVAPLNQRENLTSSRPSANSHPTHPHHHNRASQSRNREDSRNRSSSTPRVRTGQTERTSFIILPSLFSNTQGFSPSSLPTSHYDRSLLNLVDALSNMEVIGDIQRLAANRHAQHQHTKQKQDAHYVEVDRPLEFGTYSDIASDEEKKRIQIVLKHCSECSICQEEISSSYVGYIGGTHDVAITPCAHVFHSSCLHHWLTGHDTCPLCRHEFAYNIASFEGCVNSEIGTNSLVQFSYDSSMFRSQLRKLEIQMNHQDGKKLDMGLYRTCLKLNECRIQNLLTNMYILIAKFKRYSEKARQQYEKSVQELELKFRSREREENVIDIESFSRALQYDMMKRNVVQLERHFNGLEKRFFVKLLSCGTDSVKGMDYNQLIWSWLSESFRDNM